MRQPSTPLSDRYGFPPTGPQAATNQTPASVEKLAPASCLTSHSGSRLLAKAGPARAGSGNLPDPRSVSLRIAAAGGRRGKAWLVATAPEHSPIVSLARLEGWGM
jgi:hypothetical protein